MMSLFNNKQHLTIYNRIRELDNDHPYIFSSIISALIMLYALFYTTALEIVEEDILPTDKIEFIDIDVDVRPQRFAKKRISTDEGEVTANSDLVERAVGMSEDENPVDLAFYPNIAPPRPIGRLKKYYPKIARQKEIEATINVELLITSNGKVKNVHILGIVLSKVLPADIHSGIAKAFAKDTIKILESVRFTPPIVNGKRVAVKMEMPLRFRLNI